MIAAVTDNAGNVQRDLTVFSIHSPPNNPGAANYITTLFEAGEKDPHRLTVCGLTYLRELDGSADPVKAKICSKVANGEVGGISGSPPSRPKFRL